ncbi:DUF4260 family protein [Palleronia abyssalis]|nr:DUF4260 family protein [Palleronia abyssalis]
MDTIAWQRMEGALIFAGALILVVFVGGGTAWWIAVILFFAPNISFAAYAFGPRLGAVAYNSTHIYGFRAVLFALGVATDKATISVLGVL